MSISLDMSFTLLNN